MSITCEHIVSSGPDHGPGQHIDILCGDRAVTMEVVSSNTGPDILTALCQPHAAQAQQENRLEKVSSQFEMEAKYYMVLEYEAPYSEVMMHMGLAGKQIVAMAIGDRAVQIVNRRREIESLPESEAWQYVSAPIGMGESGFRLAVTETIQNRL